MKTKKKKITEKDIQQMFLTVGTQEIETIDKMLDDPELQKIFELSPEEAEHLRKGNLERRANLEVLKKAIESKKS